ncbi:MAG: HAMP domain-containing histidine kinase, partial [Planctomycetes bacterium]|nr:HAMP domain-containing histidine kinase [Planctomycetota bacterium]
MLFSRLSWRIGAPIVLLVLAETAAVVGYLSWQIASEDRLRLIDSADRMASFLGNVRAANPSALAPAVSRLSGLEVFVFDENAPDDAELDPAFVKRLLAVPVDGDAHPIGDSLVVAAAIGSKGVLVVRQPRSQSLTDPRVLQVLAAFWLLALLTTWIVLRRLGQPLRELATQLPRIDDERPIELDALHRKDEIGDVARAFATTRTALLAERETRQRVEKQAVLGRMTAALAHEVQNPVAAIRMHAQLLRSADGGAAADTIVEEAARIESLLNQWLFLTRPEPPALGDVDLVRLLADVVRSQRPRAEHAAVRLDLQAPPSLLLRADGKRLQHVFHNL